jgi:hypothetical protein
VCCGDFISGILDHEIRPCYYRIGGTEMSPVDGAPIMPF